LRIICITAVPLNIPTRAKTKINDRYHTVLTPGHRHTIGQPGVLLQMSGFTCKGNNDRKVITARPEVNRVNQTAECGYCTVSTRQSTAIEVSVTHAINAQ